MESEDSLMQAHSAQQNAINVEYDIERINVDGKFRTGKGEKPYLLPELVKIAKSLGLSTTLLNKGPLVERILEHHKVLTKTTK